MKYRIYKSVTKKNWELIKESNLQEILKKGHELEEQGFKIKIISENGIKVRIH